MQVQVKSSGSCLQVLSCRQLSLPVFKIVKVRLVKLGHAQWRSETLTNTNDNTISRYDRTRGNLEGVALFTKPSTIKNVEILPGKAATYIVETARLEDGDTVFVECLDDTGVTRLALPPRVANAIAAQRDALSARRRSIAAKALAKQRKDRGELPGFMRKAVK